MEYEDSLRWCCVICISNAIRICHSTTVRSGLRSIAFCKWRSSYSHWMAIIEAIIVNLTLNAQRRVRFIFSKNARAINIDFNKFAVIRFLWPNWFEWQISEVGTKKWKFYFICIFTKRGLIGELENWRLTPSNGDPSESDRTVTG